jgi:HD-GYP domain-containing protein (c-di-GMP phosphodiesterase class II)
MNTAAPVTADAVNQHYLDHVVAASDSVQVAASEDIVTGSGVKLLAKGARIGAGERERLLQHKLLKPLEDCVEVVDGVTPEKLAPVAAQLLDEQALLAVMCSAGRARPVDESLAALSLSGPVRSLLTIYAGHQEGRLQHAVGVAMLSLSLARKLMPGAIDRHRTLALAGLLHDVGELYLDPSLMVRGQRLDPLQWRHIASHPAVGERVLRDMDGAGPEVAKAVGQHHERLDGFGYPRGVGGDAFTLEGQVVAVAEWLMALAEHGRTPLARASMATRLVPGEFDRTLLQAVESAACGREESSPGTEAAALGRLAPGVERMAVILERFRTSRGWIDQHIESARPALKTVLEAGLRRIARIQASFSSIGFDVADPTVLLAELDALADSRVQREVAMMVAELEWRLREVERETRLRAGLLPADDAAIVDEMVARLKAPPERVG